MGARTSNRHAGWATWPSLRRIVLGTVLVTLAGTWNGAASAAPAVAPAQALVTLLASQAVRSIPNAGAPSFATVDARRPITGVRTVLPVLGRAPGGWLRVRLAGRPNGATGWIRTRQTAEAATAWHLVVDLSRRRVLVFQGGRLARSFHAVVGKPSTPTPTGTFFVEEAVRLAPSDVGAPFALALSARSNVLQEFDGGPGQIALHGLSNVGGVLGTAVSHGCIRLDDAAMVWLVGRIGAGVPVTISS
jgi:lipoprotein-anchoring transpeptidase ErfK/SrfK